MSEFRRKLMMAYAANLGRGDIVYPGLIAAWSAKGKTNEDADRNVLKDLTGNGHDITLNNFAYSGMSGYGGYSTEFDLKKWTIASGSALSIKYTKTKAILKPSSLDKFNSNNLRYSSFKSLSLRFKTNINCEIMEAIKINNNFEYTRTPVIANKETLFIAEDVSNIEGLTQRWIYWSVKKESLPQEGLIIELIPEYPDALVFDGVDDYGSNVDFGDTTYVQTMIIKYLALKATPYNSYSYLRKIGSSGFFRINHNAIDKEPFIRVAVIPNKFYIRKSTDKIEIVAWDDNKYLPYNINGYGNGMEIGKMAFYSAYLFDRSLDEQEIKAFIRKYIDPEYLLPSEIPTPDCYYDFSKGSNDDENRNTIVDQSGNGNNAVAKGFAWSGMSGYGGYNLPIEGLTIDGTYNGVTRVYGYDIPNGVTLNKLRFNISGLENNIISIRINGLDYSYNISENGYHELKAITNDSGSVKTFEIISTVFTYNNVVIEFLPEYPGALVLDGVDDYISLDSEGFKTIFMVLNNFMVNLNFVYDAREAKGNALGFKSDDSLPYSYTEPSDLLINGNTNVDFPSNYLLNKKHLVSCSDISGIGKIYIGKHYKIDSYFSKMAIYKFLGFKDKLTEEQIQYVIKKYNLLDGVDNIDVN